MNRKFRTLLVLCLLSAAVLVAGQPVATTTSIEFAPSATVSVGADVTVTASVVVTASPTTPVTSGGTLTIYRCYDNDPSSLTYLEPMPANVCGAGNLDQNQKKGKSELIAEATLDGTNQVAYNFTAQNESTTNARLIGFWAEFDPEPSSGYRGSDTAVLDLAIGPAEQQVGCTGGQTTGLQISVRRTSGEGTIAVSSRYTGSWTFTVEVTACEDLFSVFAQGGANGWSTVTSWAPSVGHADPWKDQRKNTVLRWYIGDMVQGATATMNVAMDGTIKSCPNTLNISGPWSATYTNSAGLATKQLPYAPPVLINSVCQ
ncbi:MAG TPA: hypothetical protein VN428_19115 [Bryobacteraceae bacterium]|nr:hypothetical protein [Bryobacteraceae bacterium]